MSGRFNLDQIIDQLIAVALDFVVVAAILFIGYALVRLIGRRIIVRLLRRYEIDDVFVDFIMRISNLLLMFFVLVFALAVIGVSTTILFAAVGIVLIALLAAMQGWLQNVAGGFWMLLNNPFRLNELVEIGSKKGRVEEINLFTTKLRSSDNLEIILPNREIVTNVVTNYDARGIRRIDLVIDIAYESDIRKTVEVLRETVTADPQVLEEPELVIAVNALSDHAVKLDVRPWVQTEDHGSTRRELLEAIKYAFDANSIKIPYQQLEIHQDSSQSKI